jgi:hypothetical protein
MKGMRRRWLLLLIRDGLLCASAIDGKKSRRDIVERMQLLKATLAKEAGNAETTESQFARRSWNRP